MFEVYSINSHTGQELSAGFFDEENEAKLEARKLNTEETDWTVDYKVR